MQKMQKQMLEMVLIMVLTLGASFGWYFGWVAPNDRFLRAVEVCMDGNPQAYQRCADDVKERP